MLGGDYPTLKFYVEHFEPYLTDPSAYPKLQVTTAFLSVPKNAEHLPILYVHI